MTQQVIPAHLDGRLDTNTGAGAQNGKPIVIVLLAEQLETRGADHGDALAFGFQHVGGVQRQLDLGSGGD